jgi:hypothetical protein
MEFEVSIILADSYNGPLMFAVSENKVLPLRSGSKRPSVFELRTSKS